MNNLKAPSLNSLLESDRGSNDSLLAESLQLDIEELDDIEYAIPSIDTLPTLESVLNDLDGNFDDFSDAEFVAATPTPSFDDGSKQTSILRHVILQGVTAQIKSAADRVNAGHATSVSINHKIAIGTSHGHILCFDLTQTLKWCCQEYASQGAVSSLSFNEDSTRLLAGFARGYIIMIDTTKGDIIRSLSDVITPNTGVLHIKWTERPALALCSDSGGSVWCLSFTRRLGIRGCQSRCLFSGARGEVCAVEPLMLGGEEHPLKSYCIVALATLSKFFVVMIRPRLKVIKFQVLTGPGDCLPLLAWQLVLIQAADSTRTVDPVLAAGRGNQLFFHQLCYNQGRMNLLFLRKITLSYNLLALHWIGPKSILCLDTVENLHLSEVRTNKEMECIDMGCAGLVYGSSQFKGLATGGNVSPALALAGGHACYNSVISTENQLYILGAKSLHAVTVRAWSDRISHLANQHRWGEAFELCVEVYRSVSERPKRQISAKDKILKLYYDYLNSTNRCPELCLGPIISCLIEINEVDLLWGELWDRLNSKTMYLNLITEHIENDDLRIISPIIAQHLIEYWENISLKKLEDLILKLNWECLDLHQVLTISKKLKLYKSQMHLNTKALADYTISLTELIPLVLDEDPILGNCLLVYISSCLAGRGYPLGDIQPEIIPSVKHEVLRCLTVVHSNCALDTEPPYPYLRILLKFNTRETLNVLSLAFQEKEFNGEIGQSHRQRIVNILLEIMTPEHATWNEIGCLLNFISQQIALKNLPEDDSLLRKIIDYLSMEYIEGETSREHSEREQAWLELITTNTLTFIPTLKLIQMGEKSKCYRVVEYLLELTKNYDNILNCYINDPSRHCEMFSYIRKFIKIPKRNIFNQIYNNFHLIFHINSSEIINIIIENYYDKLKEFLKLLEKQSKDLYIFLDLLYKFNNNTLNELKLTEEFIQLLCQFNSENVEQFLKQNDQYKIEIALEICKDYNLTRSCIYLYEKQGDYRAAFELWMNLVENVTEDLIGIYVLDIGALCSRASDVLPEVEKEELWFTLLNFILLKENFNVITKNILHLASRHVDLQKLVQLVLNSNRSENNFGDIKHLIVGMLSNSRYETLLLQTTSRILGRDLHNLLAKEKKISNQGIFIKSIKCVVCRLKLYQHTDNITIYGNCGHSVHEECVSNKMECPRCGALIKDEIKLAKPSLYVVNNQFENDIYNLNENKSILNVDAPPRLGIGNK